MIQEWNIYHILDKDFKKQIAYIKKYFNVISLDEVNKKGLAEDGTYLLVTFDDGYQNIYEYAFPILKEFDVCAVLFLPTNFVFEKRSLWNDRIEYIFQNTKETHLIYEYNGKKIEYPLYSEKEKKNAFMGITSFFGSGIVCTQRDHGIKKLAETLNVPLDDKLIFCNEKYNPLCLEAIKEMIGSGLITIGSHSVNHYSLANCDEDDVFNEVKESKKKIESMISCECKAFSLPGGKNHPAILSAAKEAGYKWIFNSCPDSNPLARYDPFKVNRQGITNEMDFRDFVTNINGSRKIVKKYWF